MKKHNKYYKYYRNKDHITNIIENRKNKIKKIKQENNDFIEYLISNNIRKQHIYSKSAFIAKYNKENKKNISNKNLIKYGFK